MRYSLPEFEKIDKAIEYFNSSSREDLFDFLIGEDEVLQQISLLKLDEINTQNEAEIVVDTLVGHASETREYCAFLINKLFKKGNNKEFFYGEKILSKFAEAISDVNPKVCRKIIEILPYYMELERLYPILIENSFKLIFELQEKNKDKNYQYNTKSFRLYWNVFAIGYAMSSSFAKKYKKELIKLLSLLFEFKEYTIREKAAYLSKRIQSVSRSSEINSMIEQYSDDENFFVKEIFE